MMAIETRRQRRLRRQRRKKVVLMTGMGILLLVVFLFIGWLLFRIVSPPKKPLDIAKLYTKALKEGDYETVYTYLSSQAKARYPKEEFLSRNKNIYEGMEAKNMEFSFHTIENQKKRVVIHMKMDTIGGKTEFDVDADFIKEHGDWKIQWNDSYIYPTLRKEDKVVVKTLKSKRGTIYDRNGNMLAGQGNITVIGIVPERVDDWETTYKQIEKTLGMDRETVIKKCSASWVKKDSFVPLKKVKEVKRALQGAEPSKEEKWLDRVLAIPGLVAQTQESRVYPYGEATSHLLGYVQNVSAEDLETLKDKGYNAQSVLGKSGIEKQFESKLHGTDGSKVIIVDSNGNERSLIALKLNQDGQDIHLTIDIQLQQQLYEQFKEDKSATCAINPLTGETLALVSTPSYDSNDFILGLTTKKWDSLQEDEKRPLYNRFTSRFAPGSSMKPITALIGLTNGSFTENENFGYSGLAWQKDKSWGNYYVTTLKDYGSNVTLRNALVYSDNIYFAKAALKIGETTFIKALKNIGFEKELSYDIPIAQSKFSNDGKNIASEILLADSGYGQGQMLVNPVHQASMYSALMNDGSMIQPYLIQKKNKKPSYWRKNVFPKEAVSIVKNDLIHVVEDEGGTGHSAYKENIRLAGKTGTAEIKNTKEDKDGTELGWFCVFTPSASKEDALLIVTMVEDVKGRGGSHYVIGQLKPVLDKRFDAPETLTISIDELLQE